MNIVLLELFIFIICTLNPAASVDIEDIINVITELSKNNTKHKYGIILKNKNSNDFPYRLYLENLDFLSRRISDKPLTPKQQKKHSERVRKQHEQRMDEIIDFMKPNQMTTMFLYYEVQRIKRTREVFDKLRRMVYYLESPGKKEMADEIMECYKHARLNEQIETDVWNHEANNLLIHHIMDPHNDGVV